MTHDDPVEANRRAWNEVAPRHAARNRAALVEAFSRPGHNTLDAVLTALLRDVGLDGKDVAQLCCNNGREVLSMLNLGARHGAGFDLADAFIEEARELARVSGLSAEFHQGPVAAIPPTFDRRFDLVLVTIGSLGWVPDAKDYFATARRLLRPGGAVVVYEMHPVLDQYEPGSDDTAPFPKYGYFDRGPFREEDGLDYYGHEDYKAEPHYWFHHTLADILGACLANGLAIAHYAEYGHDITNLHARLADVPTRPPMCFTLVARTPRD